MSFWYSVGDFIKLVELANELHHRFVDAPQQFRSISDEYGVTHSPALLPSNHARVRGLTIVLEDVNHLLPRRDLTLTQRKQVVDIVAACLTLLNELNKQLADYPELNTHVLELGSLKGKFNAARKQLKWEPKDIEALRARLSSNVALLNTFYTQLNL